MTSLPKEAINEKERLAALRLARSGEIGPATFRNLIDRYGSAVAAIDALPGLAARGGRAAQIRLLSAKDAEGELQSAERIGARMLVLGGPDYPELLSNSDGAPSILFVRGQIQCLALPAVAIVGARNASANGRKLAEALAAGLGGRGHIVVSGLARGIDAAAHRGAFRTGTIAVLAGGVDQIYPDEHRDLYAAIVETGAIVSEMPIGHIARATDFPRRNRIIAGLALGTIVVEAAERSGSLITARLAAELGREVFAVPGSPLDGRCRGTNQLLKDGATLVENVEDVLCNLPAGIRPRPRVNGSRANASSSMAGTVDPVSIPAAARTVPGELPARLLELLGPTPTTIDELVRMLGASAAEIQTALLDLEMEGLTIRHPGQAVSRVVAT